MPNAQSDAMAIKIKLALTTPHLATLRSDYATQSIHFDTQISFFHDHHRWIKSS